MKMFGTSSLQCISIEISSRLLMSMNVIIWRFPCLDVGVIGPVVSLEIIFLAVLLLIAQFGGGFWLTVRVRMMCISA